MTHEDLIADYLTNNLMKVYDGLVLHYCKRDCDIEIVGTFFLEFIMGQLPAIEDLLDKADTLEEVLLFDSVKANLDIWMAVNHVDASNLNQKCQAFLAHQNKKIDSWKLFFAM